MKIARVIAILASLSYITVFLLVTGSISLSNYSIRSGVYILYQDNNLILSRYVVALNGFLLTFTPLMVIMVIAISVLLAINTLYIYQAMNSSRRLAGRGAAVLLGFSAVAMPSCCGTSMLSLAIASITAVSSSVISLLGSVLTIFSMLVLSANAAILKRSLRSSCKI